MPTGCSYNPVRPEGTCSRSGSARASLEPVVKENPVHLGCLAGGRPNLVASDGPPVAVVVLNTMKLMGIEVNEVPLMS